ncbi:MAG: glutamate-5-semialdehyde dehydrogenase, partial [Desulfovibrionaceae bacterium]|nr:glutamate-5-semialdehyde dehydrogenase [Desulfovibrionaceae bacterium]
MDIKAQMLAIGKRARQAARSLAAADGRAKERALSALAGLLGSEAEAVYAANRRDIEAAEAAGLDKARLQRLTITPKVLEAMARGCLEVAAMPDPVGEIESMTKRPNGMLVGRMRVPLGVVAMIYESRPNATVDAGILCLKAGNAAILRGGSEAFQSNAALVALMHRALDEAGLPKDAVQAPPTTDREAVSALLKLSEYVDLVIPRGGEGLIRAVVEQAAMPVLKHFKGVCHIFADASCDQDRALVIVENAKMQYPSGCNAVECLLVHEAAAEGLLPRLARSLGPK